MLMNVRRRISRFMVLFNLRKGGLIINEGGRWAGMDIWWSPFKGVDCKVWEGWRRGFIRVWILLPLPRERMFSCEVLLPWKRWLPKVILDIHKIKRYDRYGQVSN